MRKSKNIQLVAAVSSLSFMVVSCSEPENVVNPQAEALKACVSNPKNTVQDCEKYFGPNPKQSAYSAKAQCEAEYGSGNCETRKADDGSNVFVPLMVGYMLGNMNSGGYNYAPPRSGYYNDDYYQRNYRSYNNNYSSGYKSSNSTYKSSSYSKPSYSSSYKSGGFGASAGAKGSCCS